MIHSGATPLLTLLFCGLIVPLLADEPGPRPAVGERSSRNTAPAAPLARLPLYPTVTLAPAQRPQTLPDEELQRRIRHFLHYGDRILAPTETDQGYIQGNHQDHQLLLPGDTLTLALKHPAPPGTLFLVYRPGAALIDPHSGQHRGTLAHRLGQLQLDTESPDGRQAHLTDLRQEMQPGDRLLYESYPNWPLQPHRRAPLPVQGTILSLPDEMATAGEGAVVSIGLGRQDRVAPGLILTIYHTPPPAVDPLSAQPLPPMQRPIGQAILLWVGEYASLALLASTAQPVIRGDLVANRE
ncbi:MAG: hypothetical protein HQM06_17730 [Magnetococcales bacterium]|nr:hypothetical protein [Magnetococcales bacterium]